MYTTVRNLLSSVLLIFWDLMKSSYCPHFILNQILSQCSKMLVQPSVSTTNKSTFQLCKWIKHHFNWLKKTEFRVCLSRFFAEFKSISCSQPTETLNFIIHMELQAVNIKDILINLWFKKKRICFPTLYKSKYFFVFSLSLTLHFLVCHLAQTMLLFIFLVYHGFWFDSLCSGGDVRSSSFNPREWEGAEMSWMGFNGPEVPGSSGSFHPRKSQRGKGGWEDRTGIKHSNSSKDFFFPSTWANNIKSRWKDQVGVGGHTHVIDPIQICLCHLGNHVFKSRIPLGRVGYFSSSRSSARPLCHCSRKSRHTSHHCVKTVCDRTDTCSDSQSILQLNYIQ